MQFCAKLVKKLEKTLNGCHKVQSFGVEKFNFSRGLLLSFF